MAINVTENKNAYTEIGSLILVSPNGAEMLNLGQDGKFTILSDDNDLLDEWEVKSIAEHWLKIYDDEGLVAHYKGDKITVAFNGRRWIAVKVEGGK